MASKKRWYVVHAYSGFEKQVKRSLEDRIERAGMQDSFGEVLVPTEEVVEMKGGQKRRSDRKFFPGYVLVEMEMTDETWHLVKDVPKVMGFIDGPFNDFNGVVEAVDYDKSRLKVAVLIFGRSTPVDLDFHQVEKA
jgi:transcriptional antiterminator NusG